MSNTALCFFPQRKKLWWANASMDGPMVGQSHRDHPWAQDCHMVGTGTIVGCKHTWSQQMVASHLHLKPTNGTRSSHIFTLTSLFIGELLGLLRRYRKLDLDIWKGIQHIYSELFTYQRQSMVAKAPSLGRLWVLGRHVEGGTTSRSP